MASKKNMAWAIGFLIVLATLVGVRGQAACRFSAIYNFGDSNSDTGGRSAALEPVHPPNGETFFRKPSGRSCDGRLVIDFIAEDLKLPYLSPYLDSVGANFSHGANFATSGSSIGPGGFSPFHLTIQFEQFLQFKSRTSMLFKNRPDLRGNLPRPEDFRKSLYTFDIGQNDISFGFIHNTTEQVMGSIPNILNLLTTSIENLYKEGARNFWIHNTGPIGCIPFFVISHRAKPGGGFDPVGCVEVQNRAAREFNKQLLEKVKDLSTKHPQGSFIYVDIYKAKYELISQAKKQGLVDPFTFCCGSFDAFRITCKKTALVNGVLYGNGKPCLDPSTYVSWDGVHNTEAFNRQIAQRVISGSLSTPPVAIANACKLQPRCVSGE